MAQTVNNPNKGGDNPSHGGQFERAKDYAGEAVQKAKDAASTVGQKASDAASAAGRKLDDAASSVGQGVSSFADRIRSSAPHEGMMGQAAQGVADRLQQGGRYLQEQGVSGMVGDLGDLIRSNPVPAVLIGVGLGFLIGRLFSRS